MAVLTVGIGDCRISNNPSDVLVTHALGSCIAVLLYDPIAKVAGLLHYMLPESGLDVNKAVERPFIFADTGIPLLLRNSIRLGAAKSRFVIMAAGGAQMLGPNGAFNIGRRNHLAMKEIFWKCGIIVHREVIGGTSSRTVRIEVASGVVQLRTSGGNEEDIVVNSKMIGTDYVLKPAHRR